MNDLFIRLLADTNTEKIDVPVISANTLVANGFNLMYFLAGAIAVIMIIFAGIMYTTSSGDTGRVTKAKNLLMYAIIGLIVILVAFTITNFVIGRFKT
jgi:multisubunit Na+/H+ antiporter MnhB subunit